MDAIVLIVGDEILRGHTQDLNLAWLARRLDEMGHTVVRAAVVPDDMDVLVDALRRAAEEADVVLTTGGLGPTHDDKTTEAVALAFDRGLTVHEPGLKRMREAYDRRYGDGDGPPEAHVLRAAEKMASIPEGARALENRVGSAVGYALDVDGAWVVVMPGVPREMTAMFDTGVAGAIVPNEGRREFVHEVTLNQPEAFLADAISRLQARHPDVAVGSYPRFDRPHITLRLRGPREAVDAAEKDAREALAEYVLE